MNKLLLLKHIAGDATKEESEKVLDWIDASGANFEYYSKLANTVMLNDGTSANRADNIFNDEEIEEKFISIMLRHNNNVDKIPENETVRHNSRVRPSVWMYVSYAAISLLILSLGINIYLGHNNSRSDDNIIAQSQNLQTTASVIKRMYTEKGVKGSVILPDGSKVKLNSDSWIEYPERFNDKKREVKFSGEGYFEVTKNAQIPMEITTTKGMKIVVLGTHFHIRSYENDDNEQTTLFSGKIKVSRPSSEQSENVNSNRFINVLPSETILFKDESERNSIMVADTVKKIAWTRSELLFEQTPISEAAKMLERWHGVKITIENNAVANCKLTATFRAESIIQIMELIKFVTPIDYKIVNNEVIIFQRPV